MAAAEKYNEELEAEGVAEYSQHCSLVGTHGVWQSRDIVSEPSWTPLEHSPCHQRPIRVPHRDATLQLDQCTCNILDVNWNVA